MIPRAVSIQVTRCLPLPVIEASEARGVTELPGMMSAMGPVYLPRFRPLVQTVVKLADTESRRRSGVAVAGPPDPSAWRQAGHAINTVASCPNRGTRSGTGGVAHWPVPGGRCPVPDGGHAGAQPPRILAYHSSRDWQRSRLSDVARLGPFRPGAVHHRAGSTSKDKLRCASQREWSR